LLLLGAFEKPERRAVNGADRRFAMSSPLCRISRGDYDASVHHLLSRIRDGEVYQVNYTVPFDVGFAGADTELFAFLAERSAAPYCAHLEHERISLVSFSPELFLEFDGDRITTKPMKGTAQPSREDELRSEKNRAEHLMIVDLLRNDLHRVCSHVEVSRLFEIERYPTFATMTSTITGKLRSMSFDAVIRATFPCGSVTGAPKRAAMQHIERIENEPRGFYTGSIGYLSPKRQGWWNVAIRTLQFECGKPAARFDAGGGIVSDSTASGEWSELFLKSRFLEAAGDDFVLIETLRSGADSQVVEAHLARLTSSAEAFGWTIDHDDLLGRIRSFDSLPSPHLVRLLVHRGGAAIDVKPIEAQADPVRICLSRLRVRSDDPLLRHKTSWRAVHDAVAKEATTQGCFDAILANERGELTEGSRTNLFVELEGRLYTPALAGGLLPGILRARLLDERRVVEATLRPRDLQVADALYVGNSARGMLRATLARYGTAPWC
jgi:para-aminobenzoate synthetase / 4-amino-4-deoxychorismate lyase